MSKFSMKMATSVAIIGGIVAGAVSASAALNLPTMSCSYMFNTNMKIGSRGASVMDLQKVLNMYPQTQIATAGAGSPGMETTYFGAATRAAVNKFQALHLAELGITAPTGNVFAGTRALLNQVCNGTVSTNPGTNPGTVSGPVSVMLSASQPTGSLITGQAGALLANLTFNGNGTVNSVTLNRGGVSDQSTLTNVYLYDGATRITDGYSFNNNGTLTMNNINLMVNGSRTISVRGDVYASATAGQTLSVVLAGYTTTGGSNATSLMGNTMTVVSGTGILTTVSLNTASPSPAAATVNAGAVNQNLWSNTLSVGVHAALLKGMTVKMIGSAPSNTLANVGLFIDGTKVASANINGGMQFVFDLSANPFSLTTGSHVVDVRGDVVGGAYRNFYLSLEKSADLMITDSQISGGTVAITPTYSSQPVSNMLGGLVTISNGTLTINQDTNFSNITTLVGGATNVKMAAYKFTAYGEDVKVNNLTFTPTISGMTPGTTKLVNVGLYINGGQVGSNQTATHNTALSFNSLGSNLIVPVGMPVTVEIRGDVVNENNANYTAGTVRFDLASGSSNAQGVGSGQLTSTGAGTGQSLSVSSTNVTFAQTSGWAAASVAPNKSNVKIGSFTLQTGSAEGVTVNNILVGITGSMIASSSITNITVKDGSTIVGTPVGNPTASNNFSVNIPVGVSTTKTFEIYADIGSGAAGNTVIPTVTITYRGTTSNVTTTGSPVIGSTVTANVSQVVAGGVTFVPSSSAVSQFLVAGQSSYSIGTFNVKVNNNVGGAVLKDVTVTVPSGTIGSVTMNGITAQVVGTTATLYNVGVTLPADASGINIPMTVSLVCVNASGGCAGTSSTTVNAAITTLTYNDGSTVNSISPSATTTTSLLVASRPTVTMTSSQGSGLTDGNIQIGTFTVSADAAGDIKLVAIPVTVASTTGVALTASSLELRDASGNTVIVGASGVNGSAGLSGSGTFSFNTSPRTITKGTSETFTVWGTFSGTTGAANTKSVTFGLGAKASFLWNDVIGGVSSIPGTYLHTYPSTTQTKNN